MASNPIALGVLSTEKRQPYTRPRVKQEVPAYGVINDGFFDDKDKFWHPGQALYFKGEPNLNLVPLNKKAYDKIQQFLDMLDLYAEEKCKKEKKTFVKQPRQEWREDDDIEDSFPHPEYAMGSRKEGKNDEIR